MKKKSVNLAKRPTQPPINGALLAAQRHEYGLTQAQCAQLIHVTTHTWYQYEAGLRTMHPAFHELWTLKLVGNLQTNPPNKRETA